MRPSGTIGQNLALSIASGGGCNAKIGMLYKNTSTTVSKIVTIGVILNNVSPSAAAYINGVQVAGSYASDTFDVAYQMSWLLIVPPLQTYQVTGGGRCDIWQEWE